MYSIVKNGKIDNEKEMDRFACACKDDNDRFPTETLGNDNFFMSGLHLTYNDKMLKQVQHDDGKKKSFIYCQVKPDLQRQLFFSRYIPHRNTAG